MSRVDWEVPTWMAKIKAEQDAARDRADVDAKDRALLEALMRTKEPHDLWKRLVTWLEKIGGLSGKTIGIRVSVSDVSSSVESVLRVEASVPGIGSFGELRSVYTSVFFTPGERRIKCLNELEEEFTFFNFCTFKNALTLCSDSRAITPEEVASDIIEHLISVLNSHQN